MKATMMRNRIDMAKARQPGKRDGVPGHEILSGWANFTCCGWSATQPPSGGKLTARKIFSPESEK